MWWLFILIIVGFLLMLPLWIWLALRHKHTAVVLRQGWTPVLAALFISGSVSVRLPEDDGSNTTTTRNFFFNKNYFIFAAGWEALSSTRW